MYVARESYTDIQRLIKERGNSLLTAMKEGKILYDRWYKMTYGLTDEQILQLANMVGVTQAELDDMQYALGVFNDVFQGNALTQAYRESYLTPFL